MKMLVLQAIVLYICNCLQNLFCCGWERGFQSSVALPCKDFGPTSLKTFLVKILKTDPCLSQFIFPLTEIEIRLVILDNQLLFGPKLHYYQ